MPLDTEPYVRRASWNRLDKLWAVGSTLFYGLPCIAGLAGSAAGGYRWEALGFGVALIAFGVFNWRRRSRDAGRLLAEITKDGIRFRDDQPPVLWTKVVWVGFDQSGGNASRPTYDHVILHLAGGPELRHKLDDRVFAYDVGRAIARLAPRVPMGEGRRPPAAPEGEPRPR